ncbi:hypothetical protein [Rothia sp. ZJ1223]|uniref:hypothetical protein n=1 Tax=Rothia sp. ZJ1223 TaxID=2811098 RepID=UPI00195A0819|nr:hypothetical protein [Rothia sp. ZJ1223]MBM7051021.1 hypothetical protein [Rothia sp. ZJ1223]
MAQKLKIRVSTNHSSVRGKVLRAKRLGIRERVLRFLFGDVRELMLLTPGDAVKDITVTTVDEDLTALAKAVGVMADGGEVA